MRSSKSRSRSKANRPRTLGNIINRVFDSSGPEGKVRGTPQQIIEKYQLLARDAQLSNDRVAAENFLQHAEHYTRMLGEAMREMAAEQEERQRQQQNQPNHNGNGNNGNGNGGNGQNRDRDGNRDNWRDRQDRGEYRNDRSDDDSTAGVEVIDLSEGDGNLVETPEARPFQPRRDDRRDDRREDRGDRPAERQDRNEPRADRPEQRNEPRGDRPEQRNEPRGDRNERRDRGEFRRDREDRRDGQPRDAAKPEQPKAEQPKAEVAAPQPVVEAAAPQAEAADAPKKPRGVRKPRAEKPKGDNGPAEAAE